MFIKVFDVGFKRIFRKARILSKLLTLLIKILQSCSVSLFSLKLLLNCVLDYGILGALLQPPQFFQLEV